LRRFGVAACVAALVTLCGCDGDAVVRAGEALQRRPASDHLKIVDVRVEGDGSDWIVDGQEMHCDVVAGYLKNDRHINLSEAVLVGPVETGNAAVRRADAVRWKLKAAGYSDVWTIGFLTSPDHPHSDP